MDKISFLQQIFNDSLATTQSSFTLFPVITEAANLLGANLLSGGKVLVCGNGGSAADAQHLASELLNRFELERPGLPAIALTTDSSTLTSIANDYHYHDIFSRQVMALGQEDDILIAISTSGNSTNILQAVDAAHQRAMHTIVLTGNESGKLHQALNKNDIEICVPATQTARIQEVHILIIHCLCALVDQQLFGSGFS